VALCVLLGSGPAWAQQTASLQGFSVVLVLGDLQGGTSSDNMPAAARAALGDLKDFLPYKSYRLLDTAWVLGSTTTRSHTTSRLRGPDEQNYEVTLDPMPVQPQSLQIKFLLREPGGTYVKVSVDNRRLDRLRVDLTSIHLARVALETELKAAASDSSAQAARRLDERRLVIERQIQDIERQIQAEESKPPGSSGGPTLIDTTFTMSIGETVVVGTSRVRGDNALIALLTAVRRGANK